MKKYLIIFMFILIYGFILAQEDIIDTGIAIESKNTPTPILTQQKIEEQTPTPVSTDTLTNVITGIPTAIKTDIELDTETKETEGIVILSPGEVEPEILQRYIKEERPEKQKIEVDEKEISIKKTKQVKERIEGEEETEEISFEYKEEAEITLIEGEEKEKKVKAGYVLVEKAGFITQSFSEDGFIVNLDEKKSLIQGQFVYANITVGKPVKKGDRFIVYDDSEEVFNPKTDEYVGKYINIVGIIKIIKKEKENIYKSKIIKNYGLIKNGFKLKQRKEISDYHNKITKKEIKKVPDVEGFIIKAKDKDNNSILFNKDIVFIDKGIENGIFPGIKMNVIRENLSSASERFNVIGKIFIINSMKNNSTAIIISQNDTIKVGDIVTTIK